MIDIKGIAAPDADEILTRRRKPKTAQIIDFMYHTALVPNLRFPK